MTKYQKLEKIIRDACPEKKIFKNQFINIGENRLCSSGSPLGLPEVLRAMNKKDDSYGIKAVDFSTPNLVEFVKEGGWFSGNLLREYVLLKKGYILLEEKQTRIIWDLTKNLKDQKKEVHEFLYKIFKIK